MVCDLMSIKMEDGVCFGSSVAAVCRGAKYKEQARLL